MGLTLIVIELRGISSELDQCYLTATQVIYYCGRSHLQHILWYYAVFNRYPTSGYLRSQTDSTQLNPNPLCPLSKPLVTSLFVVFVDRAKICSPRKVSNQKSNLLR